MGGRQVHSVQYWQCEDSGEGAGSGVIELKERFINPVRTMRT